MDQLEKAKLHEQFAAGDLSGLYQTEQETIREMLGIEDQQEFEDTYCAKAYFLSVIHP